MSYSNMPGVLLCGRRQEESSCRESKSEQGFNEGQFFAERAVEILGMWITVNRVMKLLKRQKVLFGVEVSKAGRAEPGKSSLSLRERNQILP